MHLNETCLKQYPAIKGIHPACATLPEMSDEDFQSLEQSILKTGLQHPVLLDEDGLLVDGRHRLIACNRLKVEARFETVTGDIWQRVIVENIAHRHMNKAEKAFFAVTLLADEKAAAKARQREHGGTAPGKTKRNTSGKNSSSVRVPQSRDAVGELIGVNGKYIAAVAYILEFAPELKAKVLSGKMNILEAEKEAKKRRTLKSAKKGTSKIVVKNVDGKENEIPWPKAIQFESTSFADELAAWQWNPITGCRHGCEFCSARARVHSLKKTLAFPFGFEPTFYECVLDAPPNTKLPESDNPRDRRVSVCPMADLFGDWVPANWQQAVLDACLATPQWEYVFLTHWPAKYHQIPLLENACFGATINRQTDVAPVEQAMRDSRLIKSNGSI